MLRLTCLATAVLALSAGAVAQTPPAQDASAENEPVVSARQLSIDTEGKIYIAEGDVEVRVGDRTLRADRVIYDLQSQRLRAQGNVQITDSTGAAEFADEIEVDEEFRNGFATQFSARLQNNAVIAASTAVRENGLVNRLDQVAYTGCPTCKDQDSTPTWTVRARRATQDTEDQMIYYRDAVVSVKGVPVLYAPYFAHPDPSSERRSGLLTPDMGLSSKLGAFYEQPYYWVISPSQDLTISPLVAANVNPLVKVGYRKRFFSGYVNLEGSFTHEQDFDSDGDKFGQNTWRSHLYGDGRFRINDTWNWGFGVESQTDDLYDQRYDIDGEADQRGLYSSQTRQLINQLFLTGQRPNFYLEGAVANFQSLQLGVDDAQTPRVTPSLFINQAVDLGAYGQASATLSAAALFRDLPQRLPTGDIVADTARATAVVDWGAQYVVGPGLVLQPFAQGRADTYRLDNGGAADPLTVNRSMGLVGARVSYPLVRYGKNIDVQVEPVVMAAFGSKLAANKQVPNEDSLLFELDETNVFEPEAISSYDLWEGGSRAAIGLNASARFNNGFELTGVVGRRWREQADPVFNNLSNLSGKESDYVAGLKASLPVKLAVDARFRFDDTFDFNRIDAGVSGDIWRIKGSARYYRVLTAGATGKDEGLIWSANVRATKRWSALFEQQRNITLRQNLNLAVGLAYQDECSYFSIAYVRQGVDDRQLGPSESIRVQFVLTGLGGSSSDSFD